MAFNGVAQRLNSLAKEDSMLQDSGSDRRTVSFEELAYSNMLIVQALVELLAEKGLLNPSEITQRVKKLRGWVEPAKHQRSSSNLNPPDHAHICIRCRGSFPCWASDCKIGQEFVCDDCADDLGEGQTHSTPS